MKTNEHKRNIIRCVQKLSRSHETHKVWSDFVTITACAISNSCDKHLFEKREALYMRCIQQYKPEDLDLFAEMIAITVVALDENPEQDFLGDIFEELNLHNVHVGQFFTPYSVACLMAAINALNLKEEIEKKGVISVNDCCCGAGCMLIAFANEVRKSGINYQQHVLFVAQDISMTIALMCYIQLSPLGCAGYVKVGDSLSAPLVENEEFTENIWITPMYFCEVWVLRRNLAQIMKLITNGRDERMNGKEKILSEDSVEGDETVEGEVSA